MLPLFALEVQEVKVGDLIQINLPGEASLNQSFQVDKRGRVTLPEIGPVFIAGYNEKQLEKVIVERLNNIYRDVSNARVFIKQQQLLVSVQGYVSKPGEYTLPAASNVQMFIHEAGGLRPGAQLNKFILKRGTKNTEFSYKRFLDSGDNSQLPQLRSLDILFVPASPLVGNVEQEFDASKLVDSGDSANSSLAIKVFGEVNAPGSFSFKQSNTLVDILMRAGGVTRFGNVERIRIITDNAPTTFDLKRYLDTGDHSLLPDISPGSTIFVPKQESTTISGSNTIYVMGEVATPGAYKSQKSSSLMDLLVQAGSPTRFADSSKIRILKANGTVTQFNLQAYTNGFVKNKLPTIEPGDSIFIPEKEDFEKKSWLNTASYRTVAIIGSVTRPGRIEWSNKMDLIDLLAHVGGPSKDADTERIEISLNGKRVLFNLDEFLKMGSPQSKLPKIKSGAVIRVPSVVSITAGDKSKWINQSSDSSIYLFGQINAPGRYKFTENMHFLDILSAADGPTGLADIHNIRVTHRGLGYSKVSKLNLSLYFETGDESILPKVKPGDTIYIPEKDKNWLDRSKESTIRVLGEVKSPGRYSFNDNMTILDLLAEAGGPTNSAYLEKISVVNLSCCQGQARTFNLVEFSRTANIYDLPVIRAGDTIYIPNREDSFLEKARAGLRDILQLTTTIVLIGAL
nr:SLBB domain-containing protein [Vibrio sagamiensis]